jgi:S1-C subfamily serine protease
VLAGAIAVLLGGGVAGWLLLHDAVGGRVLTTHVVDATRLVEFAELARQTNAALEREIETLRGAMGAELCRAPEPPDAVGRLTDSIEERVEQGTVRVLVSGSGGVTSGSGFFVAADRVLTGDRVLGKGQPTQIVVVGRHRVRTARVQARGDDRHDAALLVVERSGVPLPLGAAASVDDPVFAAGMLAREGADPSASLEARQPGSLLVTPARVGAAQTLGGALPVLGLTAALADEQSGGPLLDRCGRVVGLISAGSGGSNLIAARYAIAAPALLAFLQANQVSMTIGDTACIPPGTRRPG